MNPFTLLISLLRFALKWLYISAFLLLPFHATAYGLDYSFSGFASVGAGRVSEEKVFLGDYDHNWGFDTDAVLGLQLQAGLMDRLSLTAQVISNGHNYDDVSKYEPELEWLFLSYEVSNSLRVRLGRIRTPFYLFSETMEVGYSYVWVRPPIDVYTPLLSPFRNFDGLDTSYRTELPLTRSDTHKNIELEVQSYLGVMEGFFLDSDIDVQPIVGLNVSFSIEDTKFRYNIAGLRASIHNPELQQLHDSLMAASLLAPPLQASADRFVAENRWYQYHGLGVMWEKNQWSFIAEQYFIHGPSEGLSNDARGYYLSLARSFGDITPYFVFGRYKNRFDKNIPAGVNASYAYLPEGINSEIDALRAITLDSYESFNVKERTYTFGLRWDAAQQVAVKAEYQYFDFMDDSSGHMLPVDETDKAAASSLFTVVIDLVF